MAANLAADTKTAQTQTSSAKQTDTAASTASAAGTQTSTNSTAVAATTAASGTKAAGNDNSTGTASAKAQTVQAVGTATAKAKMTVNAVVDNNGIKPDFQTVKAGTITFNVTNNLSARTYQLSLNGNTILEETLDPGPNTFTRDLQPGTYTVTIRIPNATPSAGNTATTLIVEK